MKNFKHLLAVYGTLRQGMSNSRLLSTSKLLGTHRVKGFRMFSLGGFPAINKADDEITVEVYEIRDKEALDSIYNLEGYTGIRDDPNNWYDTVDINTVSGKAEIFYFRKDLDRPVVKGGDWTKQGD